MTNLELIEQHVNDTGFCSVMAHAKSVSSTYEEIVSKGMSIVPDILKYLKDKNEGMHIIMLLMAIVEERPLPYLPKIHGHWNVKEAREAWIEWGKVRQLI